MLSSLYSWPFRLKNARSKESALSRCSSYFAILALFWKRHPALTLGLTLYFALLLALGSLWALLPLALFLLTLLQRRRVLLPLCLLLFLVPLLFHLWFTAPKEGLEGTFRIKIENITPSSRIFSPGWEYHGTLLNFTPQGELKSRGSHMPLLLHVKRGKSRPQGGYIYEIEGRVKRSSTTQVILTARTYKAIRTTPSLAEWRLKTKQQLKKSISKRCTDPQMGHFLSGLATGEFSDPIIKNNFKKLGLSHLLVISGFHFSLMAYFLQLLLRPFFPPKVTLFLLLSFALLYFLFLGPTPSIQRAWVMISIYLLSLLCSRSLLPLNALGLSLIVVLILNPFAPQQVGFQLSFLATASILLFFPLFEKLFLRLLPKRAFPEILEFHSLDKHAYLLLSLIRKSLSLACAIHVTMLPCVLTLFHQFPLLGVSYNLLFPLLFSLTLLLLLLSCIFLSLPFVSDLLFYANIHFTQWLLTLLDRAPLSPIWYCEALTPALLIIFLSLLFPVALFYYQKSALKHPFFLY